MKRRGQCRCGTILEFEKTSLGYKTRCPQCKAVVRLRPEAPAPQAQEHKQSSAVLTAPSSPPPLPPLEATFGLEMLPGPTLDDLPPDPPDFSILGEQTSTAPAAQADMPAYCDAEPAFAAGVGRWWVFGLTALAVVLAVTTAAILWG